MHQITKATKLKETGLHPSDHPGLSPELDFGKLMKYGRIGLEVFQALEALHGAPVGASGSTPPLKTDVGSAGYTIVLDWSRTK